VHRHRRHRRVRGLDHARPGAAARVRHHPRHHRADRRARPLPAAGRVSGAPPARLPAGGRGPGPAGGPPPPPPPFPPPRYIPPPQAAFLVVQNVATAASNHASFDGFPAYSYAWQLFQLPYAVVGISVITALLPRMSAHASEKNYALVKSDFSGGVRLSSVIVVPAALVLAVLGPALAEPLFGYGSTSVAEAREMR